MEKLQLVAEFSEVMLCIWMVSSVSLFIQGQILEAVNYLRATVSSLRSAVVSTGKAANSLMSFFIYIYDTGTNGCFCSTSHIWRPVGAEAMKGADMTAVYASYSLEMSQSVACMVNEFYQEITEVQLTDSCFRRFSLPVWTCMHH